MNAELEGAFDLNGEPVAVPCSVGVQQGCPLSPAFFLFVMQACLKLLDRAMPAEAKPRLCTNTRISTDGGIWPGTDRSISGEFEVSFWASLALTTPPRPWTHAEPS